MLPAKLPLRSKRFLISGGVGTLLVAVILGAWSMRKASTLPQQREPERVVVTYSTSEPSEINNKAAIQQWQGPAKDPKYIRIPTRSIEGYIQAVGVDQNGAVAVPNNIHYAGWYVDSQLPGERGNSVITGHIDGRTMPGIFSSLATLQKDDEIEIESGNGTKNYFTVTERIVVAESEAIATLFTQDPAVSSQLSLISCTGKLNPTNGRYEDRVIVRAVKRL